MKAISYFFVPSNNFKGMQPATVVNRSIMHDCDFVVSSQLVSIQFYFFDTRKIHLNAVHVIQKCPNPANPSPNKN